MPADLHGLTTLIKTLPDLTRKVEQVKAKFASNARAAAEAVDAMSAVGDQLGQAAGELRGALGLETNGGPPLDEAKAKP